MTKKKSKLLGRQLWCVECLKKRPPNLEPSDYLILSREMQYGFKAGTIEIDKSVVGICEVCVTSKSQFQQNSKQPVDVNHPELVYTNA
jgi:hypothetical protein